MKRQINLKEVYLLGHTISYVRVAIRNSWPVKIGDQTFLYTSLDNVLSGLKRNDIGVSIHSAIDKWLNKLKQYDDGEQLRPKDKDPLYTAYVKWDERIKDELLSTPALLMYTEGTLNYKHLQNGAAPFIRADIWDRLSKISKFDLDDAAMCLLCELPTPAAMIALRATEDAVRRYYEFKTRKKHENKGWNAILRDLESKDSSGKYKYKVNLTLMGHLDYIRENKRNVAEHPEKRFSQPEAETIFTQVIATISEIYAEMPIRKKKVVAEVAKIAAITS